MIDVRTFEERLFAWIDGELPPADAREVEAFCEAHPEARARADAERAFDARVKVAILGGARGKALVADALRRARADDGAAAPAPRPAPTVPPAEPAVSSHPAGTAARTPRTPAPAGRLLRLRRRFVSVAGLAAAASIGLAAMWFNCIPPFECACLAAMEAASDAPAFGVEDFEGAACEVVPLDLAGGCHVLRRRVPFDGGEAVVLVCTEGGVEPTPRAEMWSDGHPYWVAGIDDRTVVAYRDPGSRALVCFVADAPEAKLLPAAKAFRAERAAAAK